MKKKILIIAPNDNHLLGFISHLNLFRNSNYSVDHFSLAYKGGDYPFDNSYHIRKHLPKIFYLKPFMALLRYIDLYLSFKGLKSNYDLINVHFVTVDSFLLLKLIKRKSNKLVLTPWGSDALRVKNSIIISFLKKLYKSADYITLANIRFRFVVIKKFDIPADKIVNLSYGATMIDFISENSISTSEAKERIGLDNAFIITAGYNRSPLQNHKSIIEAIKKCKELLPDNLIVLFPFTYNGSIEPYKSELIQMMDTHHIKYAFFESFLDNDSMRNIVFATDIFINVQETDANSASLQEYLLAGKIVVNGSWLKYDHLEEVDMPYYLTIDKDKIHLAIHEVVLNSYKTKVNQHHKNAIKKFGWKNKAFEWNEFFKNLDS